MTVNRRLAVAVMTMVAVVFGLVTGAQALPEFFSTGNVTFTGTNLSPPVIKAKNLGIEGTIKCEKATMGGTAINKTMEVQTMVISFSGKCEQTIGSSKSTCSEPITTPSLVGTLGYIKEIPSLPVGLLLKPKSGLEILEPICGGDVTELQGEVVGEFLTGSINKSSTKLTVVLGCSGVKQNVTTFLLLAGAFMSGVNPEVTGFFGGEACLSVIEELTFATNVEIKG